MLEALIGISAGFVLLFMFLWTYMRFQKIAKKQKNREWHKKLWWGLLIGSLTFMAAATIYFFMNK